MSVSFGWVRLEVSMNFDHRCAMAYERSRVGVVSTSVVQVPIGRTLLVGRRGDIPLGVEVPDSGVSRRALTLTSEPTGWLLDVSNRNGAVLHCWGQKPLDVLGEIRVRWPRVAVRFLNGSKPNAEDDREHWILLESNDLAITREGPQQDADSTSRTFTPGPPPNLTDDQLAAVEAVFSEVLQWPPVASPQPRKLSSVARELGISTSAVQERLKHAREKAIRCGFYGSVGLTDSSYLYALVRSEFMKLPPPFVR